jgi:NADH-quinone oxidoreductase subunit H
MSIDFAFLLEALIKLVIVFHLVLIILAYTVYAERRVLAVIQNRLGPNRVGPQGLLQPFADLLKFIFKEELVPLAANKWLYLLAPLVAVVPAFMTMAVYPFGGKVNLPLVGEVELVVTHFNVSLLYIFALTGLGVYGIVLAGWASNSKYSLLGGLRSSAQMVSYELSLSLSLIGVLIQAGSLDLTEIIQHQAGWGGMKWHIIYFQPIGFFIYLISAIAETNRVPFDLPEAETELVAGFHTEYSAMKFALFFLGEYANMFTVSVVATVLFLGGWQGPFVEQFPLLGPVYFLAKVFFFLFLYIWLRATLPRFRYDQLMDFGWKFLLPAALFNIVLSATIALFAPLD